MSKASTIARWVLAGPVALLVSILAMASTPVWLPSGSSGVDNIVLPLVLFPLYWAAALFYVLLEESMARAGIVMAVVLGLSGYLIFLSFTTA